MIVVTGNRLNNGAGRKGAILEIAIIKNKLESVITIAGLLGEKRETPFKTPNTISSHSKPHQNTSPSLPPSLTLKKDLLPLIFSLKFL